MTYNEPIKPYALEADDVFAMRAGLALLGANDMSPAELAAYVQAKEMKAEDLTGTRAGLALANDAYTAGISAGIRACNKTKPGEPFIKPVSPYSAPLLAMIKVERAD